MGIKRPGIEPSPTIPTSFIVTVTTIHWQSPAPAGTTLSEAAGKKGQHGWWRKGSPTWALGTTLATLWPALFACALVSISGGGPLSAGGASGALGWGLEVGLVQRLGTCTADPLGFLQQLLHRLDLGQWWSWCLGQQQSQCPGQQQSKCLVQSLSRNQGVWDSNSHPILDSNSQGVLDSNSWGVLDSKSGCPGQQQSGCPRKQKSGCLKEQ